MLFAPLFLTLLLFHHSSLSKTYLRGEGYEYWCVGNCHEPLTNTSTTSGIILMGGGADVDEAFDWLSSSVNGGDVVVLRNSGGDGYNDYLFYDIGGFNSVSTIKMTERIASSNPFVVSVLRSASGIWFAGGDQSKYWNLWKDSPVEKTIQDLLDQNQLVIGGTSAGCAIMPQWVYTAEYGSVDSASALTDPYDRDITFGDSLFKQEILKGVITDTHFQQRDRMGRSITFLARLLQDKQISKNSKGIAVNEGTALLIDSKGYGRVVTAHRQRDAAVFFLQSQQPPQVCSKNKPLTIRDIQVYKGLHGDRFDLVTWKHTSQPPYFIDAIDGYLNSSSGYIYYEY